jgi:hypothetical protein
VNEYGLEFGKKDKFIKSKGKVLAATSIEKN